MTTNHPCVRTRVPIVAAARFVGVFVRFFLSFAYNSHVSDVLRRRRKGAGGGNYSTFPKIHFSRIKSHGRADQNAKHYVRARLINFCFPVRTTRTFCTQNAQCRCPRPSKHTRVHSCYEHRALVYGKLISLCSSSVIDPGKRNLLPASAPATERPMTLSDAILF